jgi:3',5'-cyclic AMP phosphodiesterase CpdA
MSSIVHLSDLHLSGKALAAEQGTFENLCAALKRERLVSPLVVLTGDLFTTRRVPPRSVERAFDGLWEGLTAALDRPRLLLLPGNHDVRVGGVAFASKSATFLALRAHAVRRGLGNVHVSGAAAPRLIELIDPAFHGLPANLVAYDSTWLPTGLFSSGGAVRREDILSVAPRLQGDLPIVFLLHHHLIPTPVADLSLVGSPGVGMRALQYGLSRLIANGDHEEILMTALGAGTALSTLQALGRPVVVLHGHKHYPAVRHMKGVFAGHADLLALSAGAAGRVQAYAPKHSSWKTWPSFNVLDLDAEGVTVKLVSFDIDPGGTSFAEREIVRARRHGAAWSIISPAPSKAVRGPGPEIHDSVARYTVTPSKTSPSMWDITLSREIIAPGALLAPYDETIEIGETANVVVRSGPDAGKRLRSPFPLRIAPGVPTVCEAQGALCRTLGALERRYGKAEAPFEWVALLTKYASRRVRLELEGIPREKCFASITDMTTGQEAPAPLLAGRTAVEITDVAPKTLLRIHWALD